MMRSVLGCVVEFSPASSLVSLAAVQQSSTPPRSGITHVMAEQEVAPQLEQDNAVDDDDTTDTNYKPPAQKSLQEIQELDKDDESLRKYKETLLGNTATIDDPNIPNIQVTRMTLVCDNAPSELALDLQGDLDSFKSNPVVMKEGVEYRVKINFKVNREIISGLKYVQASYRGGVRVDKSEYMVGSYGPRPDKEYEYLTTVEEAPKGMLARGSYNIKSKFTDDDKHDHLSWDWKLNIKKGWHE